MTIYEIKNRVTNAPYFFNRDTMRFFNQKMRDFRVYKLDNGNYRIAAPMRDHRGEIVGTTEREFNPQTNEFL